MHVLGCFIIARHLVYFPKIEIFFLISTAVMNLHVLGCFEIARHLVYFPRPVTKLFKKSLWLYYLNYLKCFIVAQEVTQLTEFNSRNMAMSASHANNNAIHLISPNTHIPRFHYFIKESYYASRITRRNYRIRQQPDWTKLHGDLEYWLTG